MQKYYKVISFFCLALTAIMNMGGYAASYLNQETDSLSTPNIVVIMADDHGQWASEVYGNRDLHTPNMKWLANHGVAFSQAYAISPVCSPSRASFFTGRMPSQHGVHDFLSETEEYDHNWLKNETFLSELLQTRGYQTALVGKWHATTNSAKVAKGFDFWFSYDVQPEGWSNQYQHSGEVHFSDQGMPVSFDGNQSQRLTDQAIKFLDRQVPSNPFFLFMGFVDTHAPFGGQPERLVAPFRSKPLSGVLDGESSRFPARGAINKIPADHNEQLAQYYAGVEMMDSQLGRLIDYLESRQMLHNTLIIYTSDHGHMNGHHGLYGKGNATRPQNFYQENILVPLTLTWAQEITPIIGKVLNPVSTCDLHQTLLEVAGVKIPDAQKDSINSPGKNILELLNKPSIDWSLYKFSELGNARMISNEHYKLVRRYPPLVEGYGDEFYDLSKDPREHQNVLDHPSYTEQINTLKTALEMFFNQYQEPEHSGTNLSNQPPANANEQWRSQ